MNEEPSSSSSLIHSERNSGQVRLSDAVQASRMVVSWNVNLQHFPWTNGDNGLPSEIVAAMAATQATLANRLFLRNNNNDEANYNSSKKETPFLFNRISFLEYQRQRASNSENSSMMTTTDAFGLPKRRRGRPKKEEIEERMEYLRSLGVERPENLDKLPLRRRGRPTKAEVSQREMELIAMGLPIIPKEAKSNNNVDKNQQKKKNDPHSGEEKKQKRKYVKKKERRTMQSTEQEDSAARKSDNDEHISDSENHKQQSERAEFHLLDEESTVSVADSGKRKGPVDTEPVLLLSIDTSTREEKEDGNDNEVESSSISSKTSENSVPSQLLLNRARRNNPNLRVSVGSPLTTANVATITLTPLITPVQQDASYFSLTTRGATATGAAAAAAGGGGGAASTTSSSPSIPGALRSQSRGRQQYLDEQDDGMELGRGFRFDHHNTNNNMDDSIPTAGTESYFFGRALLQSSPFLHSASSVTNSSSSSPPSSTSSKRLESSRSRPSSRQNRPVPRQTTGSEVAGDSCSNIGEQQQSNSNVEQQEQQQQRPPSRSSSEQPEKKRKKQSIRIPNSATTSIATSAASSSSTDMSIDCFNRHPNNVTPHIPSHGRNFLAATPESSWRFSNYSFTPVGTETSGSLSSPFSSFDPSSHRALQSASDKSSKDDVHEEALTSARNKRSFEYQFPYPHHHRHRQTEENENGGGRNDETSERLASSFLNKLDATPRAATPVDVFFRVGGSGGVVQHAAVPGTLASLTRLYPPSSDGKSSNNNDKEGEIIPGSNDDGDDSSGNRGDDSNRDERSKRARLQTNHDLMFLDETAQNDETDDNGNDNNGEDDVVINSRDSAFHGHSSSSSSVFTQVQRRKEGMGSITVTLMRERKSTDNADTTRTSDNNNNNTNDFYHHSTAGETRGFLPSTEASHLMDNDEEDHRNENDSINNNNNNRHEDNLDENNHFHHPHPLGSDTLLSNSSSGYGEEEMIWNLFRHFEEKKANSIQK